MSNVISLHPFKISGKAEWVVMDFLGFFFFLLLFSFFLFPLPSFPPSSSSSFFKSGKFLFSSTFLKNHFAGYIILHWHFFFFQHFKHVIPLPSRPHCFKWESIINFIENALSLMSWFSITVCKILSLILQIDYNVSSWRSLNLSFLEFTELLGFVDLCISSNLCI